MKKKVISYKVIIGIAIIFVFMASVTVTRNQDHIGKKTDHMKKRIVLEGGDYDYDMYEYDAICDNQKKPQKTFYKQYVERIGVRILGSFLEIYRLISEKYNFVKQYIKK